MDKHKIRAGVYISKMAEYLDEWVRLTEELELCHKSDTKTVKRILTLTDRYFSCTKSKDAFGLFDRISLVNSMAALSGRMEGDWTAGEKTQRIISDRMGVSREIAAIRMYYNQCVKKVNVCLDRPVHAAIAKLFRLYRLELLSDLTK
jgi:hypothetical protein